MISKNQRLNLHIKKYSEKIKNSEKKDSQHEKNRASFLEEENQKINQLEKYNEKITIENSNLIKKLKENEFYEVESLKKIIKEQRDDLKDKTSQMVLKNHIF